MFIIIYFNLALASQIYWVIYEPSNSMVFSFQPAIGCLSFPWHPHRPMLAARSGTKHRGLVQIANGDHKTSFLGT